MKEEAVSSSLTHSHPEHENGLHSTFPESADPASIIIFYLVQGDATVTS